jgi:hypothetical protein
VTSHTKTTTRNASRESRVTAGEPYGRRRDPLSVGR